MGGTGVAVGGTGVGVALGAVVGVGVGAGAQRATSTAPTLPPTSCTNRRRVIFRRSAFTASLSSIFLISFLLFAYRISVLAAKTATPPLAPLAETGTPGPCYPLHASLTAELYETKTDYHHYRLSPPLCIASRRDLSHHLRSQSLISPKSYCSSSRQAANSSGGGDS